MTYTEHSNLKKLLDRRTSQTDGTHSCGKPSSRTTRMRRCDTTKYGLWNRNPDVFSEKRKKYIILTFRAAVRDMHTVSNADTAAASRIPMSQQQPQQPAANVAVMAWNHCRDSSSLFDSLVQDRDVLDARIVPFSSAKALASTVSTTKKISVRTDWQPQSARTGVVNNTHTGTTHFPRTDVSSCTPQDCM